MEHFLEFVAEIMEVEPVMISMATEYRNFEKWDSFMMLTLVMELEQEYEVSIPMEELNHVETLADVYRMTVKHP